MKKDPAFLFYSKDFYEGTRLMLPEERACLIDLMIYQHQNGGVPNDVKRLTLYCSGVSEEAIKSTLDIKFKLVDSLWYSKKMSEVTSERSEKGRKNKLIGTFGHVVKKLNLSVKDEKYIKSKFDVAKMLQEESEWDSERLTEWCKNAIALIEDANANVSIGININYAFDEFWDLYDKKVGDKAKCKAKWDSLKDSERGIIIKTIPSFKSSISDRKFLPYPSSYLNQERWLDECGGNDYDINSYFERYGELSDQERNNLSKLIEAIPIKERTQRQSNHLFQHKPTL